MQGSVLCADVCMHCLQAAADGSHELSLGYGCQQLAQMALLYAHLGASRHAELEQISRAMLAHSDLVAGAGRFDTELMGRSHGQVLSKGGAEGIQCLSRIGEGLGVAIKVEDGSRRAKQAVALHLLRQLEWLTPMSLQELEEQVLILNPGVHLEVNGSPVSYTHLRAHET